MELTPQSKVNGIISNFRSIFKSGDIAKMNKSGYGYIYLASGYIAHYNMYGFIDAYEDALTLAKSIVNNVEANKWLNFREGEKNYDYYKQKAEIYKAIYDLAVSYIYKETSVRVESTDFSQREFHTFSGRVVFPEALR